MVFESWSVAFTHFSKGFISQRGKRWKRPTLDTTAHSFCRPRNNWRALLSPRPPSGIPAPH